MGKFEEIIEARQKLCEATQVTQQPAVTPHQQPQVAPTPQMTADQIKAYNTQGSSGDPNVDAYLKTQTPEQIAKIASTIAPPPPPAQPEAPAAPAAQAAPATAPVAAAPAVQTQPAGTATTPVQADPYEQGRAMARKTQVGQI